MGPENFALKGGGYLEKGGGHKKRRGLGHFRNIKISFSNFNASAVITYHISKNFRLAAG